MSELPVPARSAGMALRRYGLTLMAFAVAWLWLTTPWWLDGLVIPYDSINHFYAQLRGVARYLGTGDWPAWLPQTYAGRPTLADPQALVVTPALTALAWLDPTPSVHAMDFIVHAYLLVGGGALAIWGLRRGVHPLAAFLAALVFAFGGSAMGRSQHTLILLSYAWLPVAMLSVELLLERPGWRRALVTALVLAMLTINRDHVALISHLVIAGTAVAWLGGQAAPGRALARAWPWIGLSLVVWLAIIAVPVLASIAYVANSTRPGFDTAVIGFEMALPWRAFLTLPFPDMFATLSDHYAYWGPLSPIDAAIVQMAIGVVPFAVLLWLGISRGFVVSPGARLGAIIALAGLGYAVGTRTPFFELMFTTVPGLDLYQRPADASFILNLGLALVLMGILDRYLQTGVEVGSKRRLALDAAGWLLLVATAIMVALRHDRLADTAVALLVPTVIAAVTVALLVWGALRTARARQLVVVVLAVLTLWDLSFHTVGTPLNARPATDAIPLAEPDDDEIAHWLMERMAAIEASDGPMRVELLGLGGAWQNASLGMGVDNTLGYNPLLDGRYAQATGAGLNSGGMWRYFGTLVTNYADPFVDLLGVRYIVLGGPMEEIFLPGGPTEEIDPASVEAFPEPLRVGRAYIYENVDAVPRLVLIAAENVRQHDPAAVLASGDLPDFDGRVEALIEGVPPRPEGPPAAFAGELRVVERGPDRWLVEITSDRAAWVVFHEMAAPGWAAWVDGERRALSRANVLFQAVPVEAGEHEIVFSYAPWRAAWSVLPW